MNCKPKDVPRCWGMLHKPVSVVGGGQDAKRPRLTAHSYVVGCRVQSTFFKVDDEAELEGVMMSVCGMSDTCQRAELALYDSSSLGPFVV